MDSIPNCSLEANKDAMKNVSKIYGPHSLVLLAHSPCGTIVDSFGERIGLLATVENEGHSPTRENGGDLFC